MQTGPKIVVAPNCYSPLHFQRSAGTETAPHVHKEGQLLLILDGAMTIWVNDLVWAAPIGLIAWIPPAFVHRATYHGNVEAVGVYIEPRLCRLLPDFPRIVNKTPLLPVMLKRLGIQTTLSMPISRRRRMLAVVLDEVCASGPSILHLPSPNDPRLISVSKRLMEDPAWPLSLDSLSREVGISRRSLTRMFREQTGISLTDWYLRRRMIAAMEWLAANRSVTSVAVDLGYESVSSFTRAFRKMTGSAPSVYRQGQTGQ
jgi:AraC-like DNA-binding protein